MDDDSDEDIEVDIEDDFDMDDISDEEVLIDLDDDVIEDYRDVEGKAIKFKNSAISKNIDLSDEMHCILYVVPDNERETSQIMTLEEMTEAIGIRATEIENGAPVFTDVTGLSCPIAMARKEILDGKSPYKVVREVGMRKGGKEVEIWKINEMTLPIEHKEDMTVTKKRIAELGLIAAEAAANIPKNMSLENITSKKSDKFDKPDKSEKSNKSDKSDKSEKSEKTSKSETSNKSEKSDKSKKTPLKK